MIYKMRYINLYLELHLADEHVPEYIHVQNKHLKLKS